MNYKKIIQYLIFLLPWILSTIIFKIDVSIYNLLNKPFFSPPSIIFSIIWPILYILISYSIYKIWFKSNPTCRIYLFINYLSNQLYTFCFFILKNNFLSLVDTIIILTSSIYLYLETKNIDKTHSKYLIPYIIWNIFALILSFSIFILN